MVDRNRAPGSLAEFVRWLEHAPASTTIAAADLSRILAPLADAPAVVAEPQSAAQSASWRERLWTVAPETRIGIAELAEALGRPKSFVYRHTSEKAAGADRLPHRRLDGELVFVVSEIRTWILEHEEIIEAPRDPARLRRVSSSPVTLHR